MVEFQMGRAGVRAAARSSLIFGVTFCTAINIVGYVSSDSQTLGELFGRIATDIAKCLVASGVAISVGVLVAGAAAVSAFALGPIVVALAFGVGASLLLDWIDERFQITQWLGKKLDAAIVKLDEVYRYIRRQGQDAWQAFQRNPVVIDLSRDAYSISKAIYDDSRWVYWKVHSWIF